MKVPLESSDMVVISNLLKSSFVFNLSYFRCYILFWVILYLYNLMLFCVCDNRSNLFPDFPCSYIFLLNTVLFQNCVLDCDNPTICKINVPWSWRCGIIMVKIEILKLSSFCFGADNLNAFELHAHVPNTCWFIIVSLFFIT